MRSYAVRAANRTAKQFQTWHLSTVLWTVGAIFLIIILCFLMIYFRDPGRDIPQTQWWLSMAVIGVNSIGLIIMIKYSYAVSLDVLEERDESQDIKKSIKESLSNVGLVSALVLSISIPMLQFDIEDKSANLAFVYASSITASVLYAASATCLSAFAILYFGQLPTSAVAGFIMQDPRIVGYPLLSLVMSVAYMLIGIVVWFLIEYGYVMACTATCAFIAGTFIVFTFTLQISAINADKMILEFPVQPSPEQLHAFLKDYFNDVFIARENSEKQGKNCRIEKKDAWLYGSLEQFTSYVVHRQFMETNEGCEESVSERANNRLERRTLKRRISEKVHTSKRSDADISMQIEGPLDTESQLTPVTRDLIKEMYSSFIKSSMYTASVASDSGSMCDSAPATTVRFTRGKVGGVCVSKAQPLATCGVGSDCLHGNEVYPFAAD